MSRSDVGRRPARSYSKFLLRLALVAGLVALVAAIGVVSSLVEPARADVNECADQVDNDGDGLIDQRDPGCLGRRDVKEDDGRQLAPAPTATPTPTPTATPTPTPTRTPVPTPTATPVPPPPAKTQCADGKDNDSDNAVDLKDPGCTGAKDDDEKNPPPTPKPTPTPKPAPRAQCNDGLDNDKDGKTDFGPDPGCLTAADTDETDPSAPAAPAPAAPPPAGQVFGTSGSSPAPRAAAKLISPFPVVRITGRLYRTRVRINRLTVKAPAGAMIAVRCTGSSCGRSAQRLKARKTSVNRRLHRFERTLRVGSMLEIRVYKPGRIGKYTRFVVRRAKAPGRSDRCLSLNRRTPRSCPGD